MKAKLATEFNISNPYPLTKHASERVSGESLESRGLTRLRLGGGGGLIISLVEQLVAVTNNAGVWLEYDYEAVAALHSRDPCSQVEVCKERCRSCWNRHFDEDSTRGWVSQDFFCGKFCLSNWPCNYECSPGVCH